MKVSVIYYALQIKQWNVVDLKGQVSMSCSHPIIIHIKENARDLIMMIISYKDIMHCAPLIYKLKVSGQ